MDLDIRLPIGLMFCVLGPILLVTALSQRTAIGLYTGGSMLVFGLFMLGLGIRGHRRA